MKMIVLLFGLGICATISHAQKTEKYAEPMHIPTNIERYKIDYELVDESIIAMDNSILNNIELFRIEELRRESEDVTFLDSKSGLEIVIYSKEKVALRKKGNKASVNNSTY